MDALVMPFAAMFCLEPWAQSAISVGWFGQSGRVPCVEPSPGCVFGAMHAMISGSRVQPDKFSSTCKLCKGSSRVSPLKILEVSCPIVLTASARSGLRLCHVLPSKERGSRNFGRLTRHFNLFSCSVLFQTTPLHDFGSMDFEIASLHVQ